MSEDTRCCGSGTCLINAAGKCWCGQQWEGDTLRSEATLKDSPAQTATTPEGAQAVAQNQPQLRS